MAYPGLPIQPAPQPNPSMSHPQYRPHFHQGQSRMCTPRGAVPYSVLQRMVEPEKVGSEHRDKFPAANLPDRHSCTSPAVRQKGYGQQSTSRPFGRADYRDLGLPLWKQGFLERRLQTRFFHRLDIRHGPIRTTRKGGRFGVIGKTERFRGYVTHGMRGG